MSLESLTLLNGETFRVGSAEPKVYLARLFFRQIIHFKEIYPFSIWGLK